MSLLQTTCRTSTSTRLLYRDVWTSSLHLRRRRCRRRLSSVDGSAAAAATTVRRESTSCRRSVVGCRCVCDRRQEVSSLRRSSYNTSPTMRLGWRRTTATARRQTGGVVSTKDRLTEIHSRLSSYLPVHTWCVKSFHISLNLFSLVENKSDDAVAVFAKLLTAGGQSIGLRTWLNSPSSPLCSLTLFYFLYPLRPKEAPPLLSAASRSCALSQSS